MLTPKFELLDQESKLCIIIKAPYSKVSGAEVFIDGCDFKFYARPYFLRLQLPGALVENGSEKAVYDCDSGTFTITVCKENPEEKFEGLDLLTKLLAPTGSIHAYGPNIEVLASESKDDVTEEDDEEEDFDWQIEQALPEETTITFDHSKYGFASTKSGVLTKVQDEAKEVIDIKEADDLHPSKRSELRLAHEMDKFDDEYYLADLYQNDSIKEIMNYTPPWLTLANMKKQGIDINASLKFTDEENEKLLKLPRRDYLLDKESQQIALFSLVDLIFAYAYDCRVTQGDFNSESSWTVSKLSATLSWLEVYSNLKEVAVTCYRRSLSYPLHRHWDLTETVFKDVLQILFIGRRFIMKVLLSIHKLFLGGDCFYLLNDLYITDYCVWIQSISEHHITSLYSRLNEIHISKPDVELDIDVLEEAGLLAIAEEKRMTDTLTEELDSMTMNQTRADDVSDDSSTESDTETDSSGSDEDDSTSEEQKDCASICLDSPCSLDISPRADSSDSIGTSMQDNTADGICGSDPPNNLTVNKDVAVKGLNCINPVSHVSKKNGSVHDHNSLNF